MSIENTLKQYKQQEIQTQIILDLKNRVEQVIEFIKDLEKTQGSNKMSRKAIKTMQGFLKCNITSPAIYKRYQEVMILMEKYAHAKT